LLPALVLIFAAPVRAQSPTYSAAETERVAKLSEIYGHIKFFHPYLGYRVINWDSAFVQAAPLVAAARTDAETVAALRQLLAVLNDPASSVRLAGSKAARTLVTGTDSIQVYFRPDSTLVLKTNDYAGAANVDVPLEALSRLIDKLPKAKAVLLDLRSARPVPADAAEGFNYALAYTRLGRYLAAQSYATDGMRLRSHSGFVPEGGNSSGGYFSFFYTKAGQVIPPYKSARNRPLAILVNKNAVLPPSFYGLRTLPHVRLLSTEPLTDAALAETVSFPFSETISVTFRTGEPVNPDGSLGMSGVVLIPPTVRPEALETYALAQLRQPRPTAPLAKASTAPLVTPLARAKIWVVIYYFHAYKELITKDWSANLRPALAELAAAPDSTGYALAVAHFYRHIQDGHGAINSEALRNYAGAGGAPVEAKFIDGQPVTYKFYDDSLRAKGLLVGDIVTAVNGEPVATRIARMAAVQSASNEWTRRQYLSYCLLRSPVGTSIRIALLGADKRPKTVVIISQPGSRLSPPRDTSVVFRRLPGNLGYTDLGRLQTKDVDRMSDALKDTKAMIFDMRGYPNGTAWAIAPRLTDRHDVTAAKFSRYAPSEPSFSNGEANASTQKYFFDQRLPANDGKSVYKGKTVMLIDERTQSQAEHTGLFFEAANGTEFIGSPTAGANGDVTDFGIPGDIHLSFSGHDVRHADGRQLQQVGLQPRIAVRPTLKGLRQSQDEVLARAVKYLNTGK
jgi:C-terminal processing protease CtpA/Prc